MSRSTPTFGRSGCQGQCIARQSRRLSPNDGTWKAHHHVRDNLEACILGKLERFTSGLHSVSSIRVPRNVFVNGLHADLQT